MGTVTNSAASLKFVDNLEITSFLNVLGSCLAAMMDRSQEGEWN